MEGTGTVTVRQVTRKPRPGLRRLCRELIELQDAEHGHMAHALHEGTLQNLAALSWHINLLADAPGLGSAHAQQLLENCAAIAETCSREITDISQAMHPVVLKDVGLPAALEGYARTMSRVGAKVSLAAHEKVLRLPPDTELALFRITQNLTEAMLALPGLPAVAVRVDGGAGLTMVHSAEAAVAFKPAAHRWRATLDDDVRVLAARERARMLGGRLSIRVTRPGAARAVFRLESGAFSLAESSHPHTM